MKRESEEKKRQKTETQGTGGGEVWILCPSPQETVKTKKSLLKSVLTY